MVDQSAVGRAFKPVTARVEPGRLRFFLDTLGDLYFRLPGKGRLTFLAMLMLLVFAALIAAGIPVLLATVHDAVNELKAKDVVEIDVRGKSSVADFLIIASGTSTRHVKSIADEDDARRTLTIVGDDEADPAADRIGWSAPLARALEQMSGGRIGRTAALVLAVTVTSALPTAQNVFAHATRYRRGETVARDTILLTTLAAAPVILLTASVLG